MNTSYSRLLRGETAAKEWGVRALAPLLARRHSPTGALMTLDGPLGAGKSTIARAMLRAAGVAGPVPSPTYTLIEPYELPGLRFLHLDLYRLSEAEELALLGLDELRVPGTIALVEWAARLPDALGPAHMAVRLDHVHDEGGDARHVSWSLRD
ncbi:MAG: tRNA (adenosine(37)-N6)-threonylcarbamoyltransferase complex ATPase subunit type 1 TsaE [Pseudomonadota bacterium]